MKQQKVFLFSRAGRFRRFARKAYSAFNSMHKVVTVGVLTVGVLTFAHSSPVQAQQAGHVTPEKMLEDDLDEVTVTATRAETPLNQAARLVTVVTKAQIEQSPAQSLQELLAYVANIDVVQRGGHGVQADLSIRGGTADQTAVLLNGINITNPQTGHLSLDLPVNLSDIERIEIIHGPSALVYGSGAFSGGINIITKKHIDTPLRLTAEAGMHRLFGGEARGAFEAGTTTNSLSAGYQTSDGYIANSDYRIMNLLWQTRLTLRETSTLDLQLGYNDKRYGANTFYSARYPNQYEETGRYLGTLKGSFGRTLRIIPMLYWDRRYDRFDLIRHTTTGQNHHRGDTYGAHLMLQYASRWGTTTLGGELRRDEIRSSRLGQPMPEAQGRYTKYDDRTTAGIALEQTYTSDRLTASAGALINYNTLLRRVTLYPSVSASYRIADGTRFYASWSRSTRMPTFTDLYYTTETHHANEGLKPERSESVDLGVRYGNAFVSAYVTGFLMWGRDMIDWVRPTADAKWASWNLTEVDKIGVESGVTLRPGSRWPALGNTVLAVSYARMHQTSDSHGLESRYVLNYLRDKFTAQLTHPILKGLTADWRFRLQKRMGTFTMYENGKDVGLHAYPLFSVLDLKLNYAYRRFDFFLNLNNLYDTHYYDTGNVPQAGFWLTGGMGFKL